MTSLESGPHLAGSDIDLSQDTQRGQTGWPQPCHSRSRPPPNTIISDTRQSPFPLTGGLLSPPHSPSLPGAESLGSCCLLDLESERRGEEANAEGCGQTFVKCMNHLHSEQRGPLGAPGGARPSDVSSYLLGSAGCAHGQVGFSGPRLFLASFLGC